MFAEVNHVAVLMRTNKVSFEYVKKDGSVRKALGTRNLKFIPATSHPRGVRTMPDEVLAYYDLDKQNWRCFRKENYKPHSAKIVKNK